MAYIREYSPGGGGGGGHNPGPGYIVTQLKIRGSFQQPFPVFQTIFLHAVMVNSAKGRLTNLGNTTRLHLPTLMP